MDSEAKLRISTEPGSNGMGVAEGGRMKTATPDIADPQATADAHGSAEAEAPNAGGARDEEATAPDEIVVDDDEQGGFIHAVTEHVVGRVVDPVREHVVDPVVEHVGRFVSPMAAAVGPFAAAVGTGAAAFGHALGAAGGAIAGRDTMIAHRLHRQAREPLANLYELHPEARDATPREIGVRFVPLEEILGTAVAGSAQRGGDFLPLPPFRSDNWVSRWQRIRRANEQLIALPPVDLVKFADGFWVEDGHNRVAAALYAGGAGVDAVVTELVPLDARATEQPSGVLGLMVDADELRAQVFEATNAGISDRSATDPAPADESIEASTPENA